MRIPWRALLVLTVGQMTAASVCVGQAQPSSTAVLIEKALDEPGKVVFQEVTLDKAFGRLGRDLGVTLDLDAGALGQLPHGEYTVLSAQIEGLTWREALAELLRPLALRFEVGEDRVYIVASRELARQPQRLNRVELDALTKLQNSYLDNSQKNLLKQLREVTGLQFSLVAHGERRDKSDANVVWQILKETPQRANEVLDSYSRVYNGTWFVRAEPGDGQAALVDIVMVKAERLIEMKLEQRIDVAFRNQPVQKMLQELARRAHVEITFEPGCLALLDEDVRLGSSLTMQAGTVKSALEALAGITGLAYVVNDKGVHIKASDALISGAAVSAAAVRPQRSPLACMLTVKVPGTDIEVMLFLREDDLVGDGLLEKFKEVRQGQFGEFEQFLRDYESSGAGVNK